MTVSEQVRHTWSESDRFVARAVVQPLQRFMRLETAGGIVMMVAAVVALVWANSPWQDSYTQFWGTNLVVELGDLVHLDHLNLQTWVNDALMAIFFLLVGLEIKREVVHGELRDLRTVVLPIIAAVGGMIVPAGIFLLFNAGGPAADGWGIPMATDIAFAVGVVSLLGKRVPLAAKIFLLTLAVADDLGAILVIAVFYTDELSLRWLVAALVGLGAVAVMKRVGIHALAPYLGVGAFVWLALLESGVHATLAGVALGLMTPAWPLLSPRRYPAAVRGIADKVEENLHDGVLTEDELAEDEHLIEEVSRLSRLSISPLERLERALSPWVAFVIVPIFAVANAGVTVTADTLGDLLSNDVTLGVGLGLVLGKAVGVFGASAIAIKLGVGRLPSGTSWGQLLGLAICAGIGFTVALFVTSISMDDLALADSAKIGILLGSLIAGVAGYLVLAATSKPVAQEARPVPSQG